MSEGCACGRNCQTDVCECNGTGWSHRGSGKQGEYKVCKPCWPTFSPERQAEIKQEVNAWVSQQLGGKTRFA